MTDAWNWKSLLCGSRGEQGSGSTEKDAFQFTFAELVKQIPTKGDGTAATSGPSGMNILCCIIENERSTIG